MLRALMEGYKARTSLRDGVVVEMESLLIASMKHGCCLHRRL